MTKYTKFEVIFRNETLVFTDRDPKFRNRLDVEAWFTENRYIHGVNSQYDCTGCLFTEWFKVFRRRGRWYAYHCIGMDI